MKRVEIVNLGGRARHIESDGAAAIDAWLSTARARLNGDPDRDDLLLDFEHAIGEKCDARIDDPRDVVTSDEVAAILESLGTIEPSSDGGEPFEAGAATPPVEERARRLYRLPDERMIAGVCSGIAAWLRIDITVTRVAWVGLTILLAGPTDGASFPLSVALYTLLAVVLPRANSPETKAAAYGHGATAQDLLLQARSGTMPALSMLGSRLATGIRFALRFARVLALIAITAVLAVWVVAAGWLAVAGDPVLGAFGDQFSSWLFPLFLTCVAVILVAPMTAAVAVFDFGLRGNEGGSEKRNHLTVWLLSSTAAWVAAVTVAILVVAAIPGVRDLWTTGEARIFFRDQTYCFVQDEDQSHCQPGDVIRNEGSRRPPHLVPPIPTTPATPPVPTQPAVPTLPGAPGAR